MNTFVLHLHCIINVFPSCQRTTGRKCILWPIKLLFKTLLIKQTSRLSVLFFSTSQSLTSHCWMKTKFKKIYTNMWIQKINVKPSVQVFIQSYLESVFGLFDSLRTHFLSTLPSSLNRHVKGNPILYSTWPFACFNEKVE